MGMNNCPCGEGEIRPEDVTVNAITPSGGPGFPPSIDLIVVCPVEGCGKRFNDFVRLRDMVQL